MIEKYINRTEFDSYEDLKNNYRVTVPADFNFAYDIVDAWAKEDPYRPALLYCNDNGERRLYTFCESINNRKT